MKYISTRGKAPVLGFEDVLLAGLASDGGLYVPEKLPTFTAPQIASFASLTYAELAFEIMYPFVEGAIPAATFKKMLQDTYGAFSHKAVAPLHQIGHQEWVMDLFHGPTLAFKDFALQLLGRLLDHVLEKRHEKVTIVGATSGDTGSAAIEGCRQCRNVDIYILHPHNRVSEVQRRQMTTVLANNVHNIALEGSFDDCQALVKQMFANPQFLQGKSRLVAVNSINWARIMAQIVYYFYAAVHLGAPAISVAFSVPTGNFGDIFAGYLAKQMGLPIHQLIVATNKNDILHRFFSANQYYRGNLQKTLSPSMDIQVSSNFERLLFDLQERDGVAVAKLLDGFTATGKLSVEPHRLAHIRALFTSASVDDAATCETIAVTYRDSAMLVDPHTAIGIRAGQLCRKEKGLPLVTLATAHPAKFSEAIEKAGLAVPGLPPHLHGLLEREERYQVLKNDYGAVTGYIAGK